MSAQETALPKSKSISRCHDGPGSRKESCMSQQPTPSTRKIGYEPPGTLPEKADLKSERVQHVLQKKPVRNQVVALIMKLANCDCQRVRVDLVGGKVILSVQAVPHPHELEAVAQTALALGQEAA